MERFSRAGANVVLCDLKESEGAEIAKDLGPNCHFAPTDVGLYGLTGVFFVGEMNRKVTIFP